MKKGRNQTRYCCPTCRQAVRRVLDRERKWAVAWHLSRPTRRAQEYRAARRDAVNHSTTRPGRHRHHRRLIDQRLASAPVGSRWPCFVSGIAWDEVCASIPLWFNRSSKHDRETHPGAATPAAPPATGWSWVDRRFLREHGDHLSHEAILLYLFLAAVADQHGLSFYSDNTLSSRLRLPLPALEKACQELLERDLIAPTSCHWSRCCPWPRPASAAGRRRLPYPLSPMLHQGQVNPYRQHCPQIHPSSRSCRFRNVLQWSDSTGFRNQDCLESLHS